jgi:hypothetical protein
MAYIVKFMGYHIGIYVFITRGCKAWTTGRLQKILAALTILPEL